MMKQSISPSSYSSRGKNKNKNKNNNNNHGLISVLLGKFRVVMLLQIFLVLIVAVCIFMLIIQMHILHLHMSDFTNSIDKYIMTEQQQQNQQRSPMDDNIDDGNNEKSDWKSFDEYIKGDYEEEGEAIDDDIKPIIKILYHGGYNISNDEIIHRQTLPKWSTIMNAYGPPRIIGLDTCEEYQTKVPPKLRTMGVAGTFDSGTNLLNKLLEMNCHNAERNRKYSMISWQVPWGKHYPASHRHNHTISKSRTNGPIPSYEAVLPIVTVRDPYTWMSSMCRQSYAAQFDHSKETCPNIIPYEEDIKEHPRYAKFKYIPIRTKYDGGLFVRYESLPSMWNEWYNWYINTTYPVIIVRMEDLVFHAETVIPKLCTCAGAKYGGKLKHSSEVQNRNHGIDLNGTDYGLLRSIVKYGNITNRRTGYPSFQLQAAKEILDPKLMDLFAYKYEEP